MAQKQPQSIKRQLIIEFSAAIEQQDIDAMRHINSKMKLLYEQTGEMIVFLMYAETKVAYSVTEAIETFEKFIKDNNYYNVRVSDPDNVLFFSSYAFHLQRHWRELSSEIQERSPDPLPIVKLIVDADKGHYGKIPHLAFVLFENNQDEELLRFIDKYKFAAKKEYLFFKLCLAAINKDTEKIDQYFFSLARLYNCAILTRPSKRNVIAAVNIFMESYNTQLHPENKAPKTLFSVAPNDENQSRHHHVCDILASFLIFKLSIAINTAADQPVADFDETLQKLLSDREELFRELAK